MEWTESLHVRRFLECAWVSSVHSYIHVPPNWIQCKGSWAKLVPVISIIIHVVRIERPPYNHNHQAVSCRFTSLQRQYGCYSALRGRKRGVKHSVPSVCQSVSQSTYSGPINLSRINTTKKAKTVILGRLCVRWRSKRFCSQHFQLFRCEYTLRLHLTYPGMHGDCTCHPTCSCLYVVHCAATSAMYYHEVQACFWEESKSVLSRLEKMKSNLKRTEMRECCTGHGSQTLELDTGGEAAERVERHAG